MEDELRSEYDFAQMDGGIRGKYVERYRLGTNLAKAAEASHHNYIWCEPRPRKATSRLSSVGD